jgi:uncharacterized membrane protein YhiD involved in acid resistance
MFSRKPVENAMTSLQNGVEDEEMIEPQQVLIRLVVATMLGAIVGMERERLVRAAGLRTHALVGVGAALFMRVSAFGFTDILGVRQVTLDPSRIAAQVVSGIGFLGAGTIDVIYYSTTVALSPAERGKDC